MASNLVDASAGVSRVLSAVNQGFPGPMLTSTLDGIRQQVRGLALCMCGAGAAGGGGGGSD
jgi:hypothetical protein